MLKKWAFDLTSQELMNIINSIARTGTLCALLPTQAPDPEEPEGFDESEVSLMEDEFRAPDNDDIVMLDKCKGATS